MSKNIKIIRDDTFLQKDKNLRKTCFLLNVKCTQMLDLERIQTHVLKKVQIDCQCHLKY